MDVKPFFTDAAVAPIAAEPVRYAEGELILCDSVAQESIQHSGAQVGLYQIDREHTQFDPLYDERGKESWRGPYQVIAQLDFPEENPESRQEGFRKTWNPSAWVARKDIEESKARTPVRGDILAVWDTTYIQHHAVAEPLTEKSPHGYYFTITLVESDGHLFDSPYFVGFKLTLARNTEFTPERFLVGSAPATAL